MKLFLLPGNLVADWFGLPVESDHRLVLRIYFNIIFWGAAGSIAAFMAVT